MKFYIIRCDLDGARWYRGIFKGLVDLMGVWTCERSDALIYESELAAWDALEFRIADNLREYCVIEEF